MGGNWMLKHRCSAPRPRPHGCGTDSATCSAGRGWHADGRQRGPEECDGARLFGNAHHRTRRVQGVMKRPDPCDTAADTELIFYSQSRQARLEAAGVGVHVASAWGSVLHGLSTALENSGMFWKAALVRSRRSLQNSRALQKAQRRELQMAPKGSEKL